MKKSCPLKLKDFFIFLKQELQKGIEMKKAKGIKPRDVLPGLQAIRDVYNLPRIPVESEGGCLCYYCERHTKRAQSETFFKLLRSGLIFLFHYTELSGSNSCMN